MNKSFISFCLRGTKDKSKLSHNFWPFSGLHTLNKEIISPQSCSCFHTKWNITLYHIIPCNIMQCHTISYNIGQYDNMKGQFIFLLQIQIGISIFSHFHCLSTLFYPILTADRERSWQTYFWRKKSPFISITMIRISLPPIKPGKKKKNLTLKKFTQGLNTM